MYLDSGLSYYYPNLKYFGITHSHLSVIFEGTFNNCTALELIDLTGNPILYISPINFNGLNSLKFLYLDVFCMNGGLFNGTVDSLTINNLKELISVKCNDPKLLLRVFDSTIYGLLKMFGHSVYFNRSCVENLETLNQLEMCKQENTILHEEINELTQAIENHEDQTCYPSGTCIFKSISSDYSCVAKLYVKAAFEQNINWTGLHAIGQNNGAVMSLVINSQVMEVFPLNIGATFKNLKNLSVKNSGLTKIRVNDFKGLSKLENLDITGNNIAMIDAKAFSGLESLQKIELSSNNITVLPSQSFEYLLELKIINLSDNKLKQVQFDVISSTNAIQEVYLTNNAIVPLDRTFIWRLQKSNKIDLSGTGCSYSWDKELSPEALFYDFYTNIIVNC